MTRELLQDALEALDASHQFGAYQSLVDAIRAHLAQPQAEPEYWQWRKNRSEPWSTDRIFNSQVYATTKESEVRALYTHPAALAPSEMTREQILDLVKECGLDWHKGFVPLFDDDDTNRYEVLVRAAIEAAHGITAHTKGTP